MVRPYFDCQQQWGSIRVIIHTFMWIIHYEWILCIRNKVYQSFECDLVCWCLEYGQHAIWEIIHQTHSFLDLRLNYMHDEVVLHKKLLSLSQIFCLLSALQILTNLISERRVFLYLGSHCNTFIHLLRLLLSITTATDDRAILFDRNRVPWAFWLEQIFIFLVLEVKICTNILLRLEKFATEMTHNVLFVVGMSVPLKLSVYCIFQ